MPISASFFRQLSGKQGWKSKSCRWGRNNNNNNDNVVGTGGFKTSLKSPQMEGTHNMYGNGGVVDQEDPDGFVIRKRVMVVVDKSSYSKHAVMWALTHVANKADFLTLLHVIPPTPKCSKTHSSSSALASSLGSICKACKPEVQVEAVVIQGPKLSTVMSQVKKLGVSVLVLGQKRQSPLLTWCLRGASENEEFVEQCIENIDRHCLTIGIRKQSNGGGGYLISTRWLKNFWLLA